MAEQRARRLVLAAGTGRRARVRDASRTAGWPSAKGGERGSSESRCSLRRRSCRASRPTCSPTAWPDPGSTWCGWAISTWPCGPNRSLFDDTRDDTKAFDPEALARLDHLIAALKARGIYVALELLEQAAFPRPKTGWLHPASLPAGGGPAAEFDPTIGKLTLESARALLATSTRKPAWLFGTIRCWPGSRWRARSRSST